MRQICQLFFQLINIVFHTILILGCSIHSDNNPKILHENLTDPKTIDFKLSEKSPFFIASQLNSILNDGDFFVFNSDINMTNAIILASVHDFIEFKNDHLLYYDQVVISHLDGYFQTRFRDIYANSLSINISLFQKLADEDVNLNYLLKEISSRISEQCLAREWEQIDFTYSVFSGTAVVDLFGMIKYNLFISNYGIEFIDFKNYKMIIDIHTGVPLSFIEIN